MCQEIVSRDPRHVHRPLAIRRIRRGCVCARAGTVYAVQATANLLQQLHQVAPPLPLTLDARLYLGPRTCFGAALAWVDATLRLRCTAVGGLRMLREMLRENGAAHKQAAGLGCYGRAALLLESDPPPPPAAAARAPGRGRRSHAAAAAAAGRALRGLLQVPAGAFRIVKYNEPFDIAGCPVVPLNANHCCGSTSYLVLPVGGIPQFLSGDFRCAPAPPALAAATACDRAHAPVFCQGEHEPGERPLGWGHCGGGQCARGPGCRLVGCMQACHACTDARAPLAARDGHLCTSPARPGRTSHGARALAAGCARRC